MTFANIAGGIIFGMLGFAAFIYGKKQSLWKPMTIGACLMISPYLVQSTPMLYLVGVLLTGSLFLFRD